MYRGAMVGVVVAHALEDGSLLELRARDAALDVVRDGVVVLSSDRRHAEQAFAELALAPWQGRDDITVLLDGIGMGGTLRAALDRPGVVRVDVVEPSAALVSWQRHFGAEDAVSDPRVQVHAADFGALLRRPRVPDLPEDGWFAVLVEQPRFHDEESLRLIEAALRGGGVVGLWTVEKDDALLRRVAARFQAAARVGAGGDLGLEYIYRARRGPKRAS